ncbi:MAG: hypothetical protein ACFFBQ_18485 [Promethearchaeota archaeon]
MVEIFRSINRSKLYKRIWYLWLGQNVILLFSALLYIGGYLLLILESYLYVSLRIILSVTLFIALLLDLIVVTTITIISVLEGENVLKNSQKDKIPFIIAGCGLMWVITSILWRFPFYLRGPLNFGFDPIGSFSLQTLHPENDVSFFLFFLIASFFLFIFLVLQDRSPFPSERVSNGRMIYGLAILFGNLLIVFYGLFGNILQIPNNINLTFPYWILMLLWKLVVTPLIGIIVAKKLVTDNNV